MEIEASQEPDQRGPRLSRMRSNVPCMGMLIVTVTYQVFAQVRNFDPPDGQQANSAADQRHTSPEGAIQPGTVEKRPDASADESTAAPPKRILGLIPNYRTSPNLKDYKPLTSVEKFKMASQDSFDRGTFIMAALFGGEAQWTKATPSFGQEVPGYGRYFAASYADFAIGNYMTEAIYPAILGQDPRYFRRGTGGAWSRLGNAVSQIFWTHKDSGGMQFNFSEFVGNSTAVAISNAYYPENRNASNALTKLGIQIGVDMAGNILKEFSPELNRVFSRKRLEKKDHQSRSPSSQNGVGSRQRQALFRISTTEAAARA